MIQRIQTIFLLLAAACVFLTLKLPFYSGTNNDGVASFELNGMSNIFITILTALVGTLAIVTIFFFNKRILQIRLCFALFVLQIILMLHYFKGLSLFKTGTYSLWSLLQIVVLIFIILAAIAINKDEKLVKDSNRLR